MYDMRRTPALVIGYVLIVRWTCIKFQCRLCDRETRTTNPSHKRV